MQTDYNNKQKKTGQSKHSRRLSVRFELFGFIIWNSISTFVKSIFIIHIPAFDKSLGGRISYTFRYIFAVMTLEGPRLMLISRYRAARMEKGKKVGLSAAGGTAIAAIAITTFLIGSQLIAVTIDGKLIGYVETEEQYASLIQQAKEIVSEQVGTDTNEIQIEDSNITLETVIAPQQQPLVAVMPEGEAGAGTAADGVTVTEEGGRLIDSLIETLTGSQAIKAKVYTISINEKEFATLATLKEASDVLNAIKESYTPLGGEYSGRFLDKVEIITSVTADLSSINTQRPEDVIALLLSGTPEEISYTTQEEDTKDNIARALGIGRQELERAYPDYDFENIVAGDRFTSTHVIPFIRYEAQGTELVNEPIPFATVEEKTEELFLGQKEIQQEGELGERLVTRLVTLVNGKVIAQTDIGSEMIKEPKNEIINVGTKLVYMGEDAYVGPSDGTGGGGNGVLGRPLDYWFFSRGVSSYHNGADMLAPQGTPIYASESGMVTFSGYSGGYGNLVVIDHGNGLQTYYAHCDTLNVNAGDGVGRGQQIATVGSTGRSTAFHLHFEVRVNGAVQEPMGWIG